jgi:hypothetical protein
MINFNSKLIFSLFSILLNIFNCSEFLTIPNFDVREKFRDCYFDGVSSTYNNIVCNTNWPIQFSMMLTDKLCIEKNLKRNSPLSSMNINTCMQINEQNLKCDALIPAYNDTDSTFKIVNETIKFFNTNGSQFLEEFPYMLLSDDQTFIGYFPPCQNYNSSVNFTLKEEYDIYDEINADDYILIKQLIYEKGPILAYLDCTFY